MGKVFGAKLLIFLILLLIHLLSLITPIHALHVLAVLPSVWKSHYIFGRRLLEQLVLENGTTVTLISPHAGQIYLHNKESETNAIREIHVEGLLDNWLEMGLSFNVEQVRHKSVLERFTRLIYAGTTNIDLLLADDNVQNLLKSDEKFDILIADLFLSEAILGFSYYYQVPTIIFSPIEADVWLDDILGNPHNSALDASHFLPYTVNMTFWERSINTLMILFEQLTYNYFHWKSQETIFQKHFGSLPKLANAILPTFSELTENVSLALINSHPLLQYPRAYLPNMLEVAGIHLRLDDKLPNHLKQFIEEAPDGVIYMSLGADISTIDLSMLRLQAFLDVFTHNQNIRVLLKWEQDNITITLPSNVLINSWFPQEAILAHPNVKIFITTAGLLSVTESINGLTPMLIIPIYPEQIALSQRLCIHGVAIVIPFDDINYENLLNGINELIENVSYHNNLLILRTKFQWPNLLRKNIDKSIRYIDLVTYLNIGEFLKSPARDMKYFQVALVDVVAAMILGLLGIMSIAFFIVHKILQWR